MELDRASEQRAEPAAGHADKKRPSRTGLLGLQRDAGNRAVSSLLAPQQAESSAVQHQAEPESVQRQ
ncbi:hypothetical protein, partial [Actinoplanes sp. NPDC049265]|uniref:hypothetical protein n=1 Tax=Actinoplanes sp. NPDC049265 TaxID=3363902 RepID=UPI00372301AB